MENPWFDINLDVGSTFVHPKDAAYISEFNRKAKANVKYELSLRPEPYIGNFESKIMFLALNPGVADGDFEVHGERNYIDLHKKNLHQSLVEFPFYYLNPSLVCPGSRWWKAKLKWLIEDCNIEKVAAAISCVQFFPYHSKEYKHCSKSISTQSFTRKIVLDHLAKGLPIVLMRSKSHWEKLVPELAGYKHVVQIRNPRNPTFSPKNLSEKMYSHIVKLIQEIS